MKKPASLDEWYRLVNSIYMDRNFYRTPDSVFTHLVEVVGGLSSSASRKLKTRKNGVTYLAKALGWWLTLCGHIGVRSVEALIWKKFPYVCPYCRKIPHAKRDCEIYRESNVGIDWNELDNLGRRNKQKRPRALRSWQKMFDNIYMIDDSADRKIIFGRLAEELGELAEGIRLLPVSHAYYMNEAVDVFAWIMRYANFEESERKASANSVGVLIEDALWDEYPGQCKHCETEVCKCAPFLYENLGRLSREMPIEAYREADDLSLFTFEEKIEIFRYGDTNLTVGRKTIKLTSELLEEMVRTSRAILDKDEELSLNLPQNTQEAFHQLAHLASQQQVTQKSVDKLTTTLRDVPIDARKLISDFLLGISAGLWAEAIILFLKSIK